MPQYQGVWTLEQQAQALTNQQWVTDPNFRNTTLLLQADGTGSGSQNNTFLDGSTNNFFITRNGNTTQGSFSPFSQAPGYWSNYMTSGYLTTAANAGFALSGDFTVECWVYSGDSSLDSSTRRRIFHTGGGDIASSLQLLLGTSAGNSAVVSVLNNGWLIDGTINVVTNSWNHVAVTRSGTSLKLFVNGAQSGTTATTSQSFNSGTSNTVYIGANSSGNGIWQGYISNLRVIVGTAIYTAPFTPPTTPFATGTTNQQLLVCYNNNFNDANTATTAKTITVNSTPSVQAFGPFAPALQWTPDVVGGSGYFDGTTDYLTWTGTAAGSGAFSYEFWIYSTNGFGSSRCPLGVIATSGYNSALDVRMSGTTINMSQYNVANNNFTVPSLVANTWYHVVLCRNGSNQATVFLNGVRSSTGVATISTNFSGLTSGIGRLDPSNGGDVTGYIAGIRLITGSTPYDPTQTTITVPTAPVTAITNTQFLANFANAGIYDGKMGNVLETVGSAQVATSPVKYGSGSMYFDGTGDYLVSPAGQNYEIGAGDFTLECWVYGVVFSSSNGGSGIIGKGNNTSTSGEVYTLQCNSGTLNFYSFNYSSGTPVASGPFNLPTNAWSHVAVARANGITRVFVNGISGTAGTASYTVTAGGNFYVGTQAYTPGDSTRSLNGFIDDLRITKGVARYIANFTPPQQALPRQ